MLDARELARIQSEAEQPRVAVAAAGAATAAHVRPAASGVTRPAAGSAQGPAGAARPAAGAAQGSPRAAQPALDEAEPPSGPLTDGAEDFRAVAPPIMSFAQGRRR